MKKKFVIYNGVRVVEGWPEKVEQAQSVHSIEKNGQQHPRVRYGEESEDWGANDHPCHDCAAVKGQFHVEGCDVERCPICGGQAMGCDCDPIDDEIE